MPCPYPGKVDLPLDLQPSPVEPVLEGKGLAEGTAASRFSLWFRCQDNL
jgi:hypothetical protein